MVPFECDKCIFVKLRGRDAAATVQDKYLWELIRRMNLVSF